MLSNVRIATAWLDRGANSFDTRCDICIRNPTITHPLTIALDLVTHLLLTIFITQPILSLSLSLSLSPVIHRQKSVQQKVVHENFSNRINHYSLLQLNTIISICLFAFHALHCCGNLSQLTRLSLEKRESLSRLIAHRFERNDGSL
jgi:hypothetical protein